MSSQPVSLTCGSCRTVFEGKGRSPRCPACGERWAPSQPLPPLPSIAVRDSDLQDPAFPREEVRRSQNAPLWEFVAAAILVCGILTVFTGAVLTSPTVFIAGFGVLGGASIVYAVLKLRALVTGKATLRDPGPDDIRWRFPNI